MIGNSENLGDILVQDHRTELIRLYGDFPSDSDISDYFRIPKYVVENVRGIGYLEDGDGLLDRGIDILKTYSWCFHSRRFLKSCLKRYSKTERFKLLEGAEKNRLQSWIEGRVCTLKSSGLRINSEQLFKEATKYYPSLSAESQEHKRLVRGYIANAKRVFFRKREQERDEPTTNIEQMSPFEEEKNEEKEAIAMMTERVDVAILEEEKEGQNEQMSLIENDNEEVFSPIFQEEQPMEEENISDKKGGFFGDRFNFFNR